MPLLFVAGKQIAGTTQPQPLNEVKANSPSLSSHLSYHPSYHFSYHINPETATEVEPTGGTYFKPCGLNGQNPTFGSSHQFNKFNQTLQS